MFHPHEFAPKRLSSLDQGFAALKADMEQLGDLYDAEEEKEKEREDLVSKKQSYSIPTKEEWEKINTFWKELNVRFGSLGAAFKAFDLNGNGDLSCIEFTQSCATLNVRFGSLGAAFKA